MSTIKYSWSLPTRVISSNIESLSPLSDNRVTLGKNKPLSAEDIVNTIASIVIPSANKDISMLLENIPSTD